MTARERVQRARRLLIAGAVLRVLSLAAVAAGIGFTLLLAFDAGIGIGLDWRARLRLLPALGALAMLAWLLWRFRREGHTTTDEAVALWFERRLPTLQYALVTQVQLDESRDALESVVRAAPLEQEVRRAWKDALWRPMVAMLVLVALAVAMPAGVLGRVLAPRAGDSLARPGEANRAARNPLAAIVVRVTPPAYSGMPESAHDNPATVTALVGSRVHIEGLGSGVRAVDSLETVAASNAPGAAWRIDRQMGATARAIRLRSGAGERVLVLDPVIDSAPRVQLRVPARDTVLRAPRGVVTLEADVGDDYGVAAAQFEFIVSAGAGETFTFRTGTFGARAFEEGARAGRVSASIALDTLGMGPGDLVHLRAVAVDRNNVTGPGRGVSETRAIRIARADEYDSVAVEPAPPPALDTAALSQRMLLMLTEDLHRREPRLSREAVVSESRRIARDQTRLRKRVGEVVFLRLGEDNAGEHAHFAGDGHEHGEEGPLNPDQILAAAEASTNRDPTQNLDHDGDETPIVAINRPLLEAYNHMWRASTELETGNPEEAIPWMRRAIEALQRARAAERIYLRGRPPRAVIDLARVRGTGKDESQPNARRARPPLDPDRAARLARFDVALGLAAEHAAAAADSLLLLRLALPADERAGAIALDGAATALRQGGDATAALAVARRALAGEPPRRSTLNAWGH